MKHQQLIAVLKSYGNISESEEKKIKEKFIATEVNKKHIVIDKDSPCNKLFFVNRGMLRAYYINDLGKDITRVFAWENRFITNLISFKNLNHNNEIIESIESSEILSITRNSFDELLQISPNFKNIYINILEQYSAYYIKRFEHFQMGDALGKYNYFNENFFFLKKRLNDNLVSSFLNVSRKTVERLKNSY